MNIYHHHTIQLATVCACCPSGRPHGDAAPVEIEAPRSRPTLFGALADLVRVAVMRSLLHATTDRSGMQPSDDAQDETTPVRAATVEASASHADHGDKRVSRPTVASKAASSNALLALFSQPAPDLDAVGAPLVAAPADLSPSTGDAADVKPLSPLVAALVAAFRNEPPLA